VNIAETSPKGEGGCPCVFRGGGRGTKRRGLVKVEKKEKSRGNLGRGL